ncbi:helix-turn-helix transcriptional regulator [Terriglobus albidus]|nr:AraC family transcriptional regulator [Terriglobus albidus]
MLQTITASHKSLTPVIAPGPAKVLFTSREIDFPEPVLMERYVCEPGERVEAQLDAYVVSMHLARSTVFEQRTPLGRFRNIVKSEGAITLFPAGRITEVKVKGAAEFAYCAFAPEYMREVMEEEFSGRSIPLHIRTNLHDIRLRQLFERLIALLQSGSPCGRLYVDSLTHELAIRSLELHAERASAYREKISALPPYAFRRVAEMLGDNLHARIRLGDLASLCGYSRAHFLRMFQVTTGVTPYEYHMQMRIHHAMTLLTSSTSPLIDIAAACGFSSQSHLASVFRKRIGTTPSEFRRQL